MFADMNLKFWEWPLLLVLGVAAAIILFVAVGIWFLTPKKKEDEEDVPLFI